MENKLKKIKNIYYAETKEEKELIGGEYCTGLVIELEDGRMFRAQSSDVLMSFEQIEPLERIPEETCPTGEEEVKKLEDWLVCEICMKQSDRKRMDKELIRRGEFEVETRKRVKRVLSLAREEGRKKQAELDRKIYGMSVEEFNENYKAVEPLQNGEREMNPDVKRFVEYWADDFSNIENVKRFTRELFDLLSQSKKELLERIKAEATNRATDIEKHREPICREYFTEIARSRLLEEILNRELESLTNQKKDI